MYNILIVEDEIKIAETVISYLVRDGFRVQHATTIKEAWTLLNTEIDLIVLDLMLPDGQGEDLCEQMLEIYNIPVIMLTSKSSEQSKINGFACGADDYLTKPFSPRELVARVKTVLKRCKPKDHVISLEKEIMIHVDKRMVTRQGINIKLTPNEYKVLLCLVNNSKSAVHRDRLVEFMNAPDATDRIVDVHVRHLRQKLEDDSKIPEVIKTVYGYGYMLGVQVLNA
jgi:Response regulators consisting of a CheY-like receiver domain and a winged-helix DNA-binding domain